MLVNIIISLGAYGYSKAVGLKIVKDSLTRVKRATQLELTVDKIYTVNAPRNFGSSPEEQFARNQVYFPMAEPGHITVVLAPPLDGGNVANAGAASTVCGEGTALVSAYAFTRDKDKQKTEKYVVHEVLHLLGARHEDGGVMAQPMGRGITAATKARVRECVYGIHID